MNRPYMMLVFLTVATLIVGGAHYYLYRRLVVRPELPRPWRRAATVAIAVLGAGVVLSFMLARTLPLPVARIVTYPFYVWMGPVFLLFFTFLAIDVGRLLTAITRRVLRRKAPEDAHRRRFLARAVSGAAAATVFGASGCGIQHALGTLVVKRVSVPLRRLPTELDGFTIAQITDLHLGPTRGGAWMAEVVSRVNELKADLVAVTGDLVDGPVSDLAADVAPIGELHAPHGVFFVTGNHEYYSGVTEWIAEIERLGIRVLRNEHVRIAVGEGEADFDLAGVDDYRSQRFSPTHGHDVGAAVRGRNEARELVLLAHQPLSIVDAARHGVGLMLAGHTHGGQIWPIQHISSVINKYVKGLHKHGDTWIYVSSGTGFWGPPLRLFSTAEITLVTLRAG